MSDVPLTTEDHLLSAIAEMEEVLQRLRSFVGSTMENHVNVKALSADKSLSAEELAAYSAEADFAYHAACDIADIAGYAESAVCGLRLRSDRLD